MQLGNGVEIISPSIDPSDIINLPVAAAGEIAQGAFVYWDTSANLIKAYEPTDSTAHGTSQGLIIGVLSAGKKVNDTEAVVLMKGTVLMDATNATLGLDAVVYFDYSGGGKYRAIEEGWYNSQKEPDITLANSFLLFKQNSADADGRAKLEFNGRARFAALT